MVPETTNIMPGKTVTIDTGSPALVDCIAMKRFPSEMQILKGWKRKWLDLKAGLHIIKIAIKKL